MITKLKQYKDSLNIKTNESFDSLPFDSLKNIYNEMFYHFGDDILNYDFSDSEKYILEEIFINTENDNDDKLNREQLIHAIALIYDLSINWSDEYGIMSEQELEFQTIGEKCVNIMNEKYPSGWPTIQQIIKENIVNENLNDEETYHLENTLFDIIQNNLELIPVPYTEDEEIDIRTIKSAVKEILSKYTLTLKYKKPQF